MDTRPEHLVAREATDHLRDDEHLGPWVRRHGVLRLDPGGDLFDRLVRSILRQQVSTAAADAIEERFRESVLVTTEGVSSADTETLRDAGLSRQKVRYVRALAEWFGETDHSKESLSGHSNAEIVDLLTEVTGVGGWTARMQLLFVFARPDVFPVGDLGVRRGMETLFGEETSREEMVERAERWKPYRSYASLHLWRIVD
jgi:DNA-3-methyladenine glycosylase II